MTTYLDGKELEKQLVSEDKTTILTRISVDKNGATSKNVVDKSSHI
ncbi:hypothetical protein [Paenibacillus sp. NPDC058367]